MKYCQKCGTQHPDDAKFCANCGTSFVQQSSTTVSTVTNSSETNNEIALFPKYAKIGLGVMLFIYTSMSIISFTFGIENKEKYHYLIMEYPLYDSYNVVKEYYVQFSCTIGALISLFFLILVWAKKGRQLLFAYIALTALHIIITTIISSNAAWGGGVGFNDGIVILYLIGAFIVTLIIVFAKVKGKSVYNYLH